MKRKLLILFLTISLILSTVACTNKKANKEDVNESSNVVEETEESKTVTITDHLGRQVSIEKKPDRIVSGYYISTSALIALGLEDNIVGIEAKADKRPIYNLAAKELLSLPNVGTAKVFDLEGCIALEPDLVILPIKLKDQIKTLEDMGITVIGVNPENQELLEEMITMIAKLTGVEDYEELLDYYKEKDSELKEIHDDVLDKPKIYLAGNSSLLSTATGKMYQNDLIETAGGVNVAVDVDDTYWANISYEQLIEYNPDYIIIAPEAEYTKEDVLNDNNLVGINAIKNNNVYEMPDEFEAWDSPVPSSILGKMWLTSILYEDKYPYDKFVDEVYDFYKKFYDFEIDKEVLNINE